MVRFVHPGEELASKIKHGIRAADIANTASGTEKAQTMQTAIDALDKAGDAVQGVRVPAAVVGVALVSNVGVWSQVGPVANVTVSWPAVAAGVDGDPITVTEYEVWVGDSPTASTVMLEATVQIPAGLSRVLRVRAVTAAGVPGDLSAALSVTGAAPAAGVFAPSTPALVTGYGDVVARWDGTYTAAAPGAHTVWIEARLGAGAWVRQGMVLTDAGEALVTLGEVGDTVAVRAVSYDQLGRETGVSGVASIEIATIPGAAITAGSIFADRLEPNVGTQLNLGGNAVSINLNSRVDDAVVSITQTQQNVDSVQVDADAAAAAATAAQQEIASLAAGRVLTAENALAVLSGKIDNYENSFLFLPDGFHIRESTSAVAEMVLTSAGARLMADGVTASEWNQGQMIVDQIVANGGRIGNHALDASIAGHTTYRSIV